MKKLHIILLAFSLLLFIGCKKNTQDVLSSEVELPKFSIAEAKTWYEQNQPATPVISSNSSESNGRTTQHKKELKYDWDNAFSESDSIASVIEVPIKSQGKFGYFPKAS